MRISSNRSRMIAGGLAVSLALGGAAKAIAAPVLSSTAVLRAAAANHVAVVRWRGIHVPAGILGGVPSGASPGGAPTRPYYPPLVAGFDVDPHYWPAPVVIPPPPILPLILGVEPVGWPFDGGCFVPTDHAGQLGHYGSCAESFYRQWTNRPD